MSSQAAASFSQDDIDRLLQGGGGAAAVATGPRDSDIQLYDFRRPARVSRDRMRTLEAMYERLVRSLEGWLVSRLRDSIDLRLQSVEQISYAEFLLSLNTPSASFLVRIEDAGSQQGVVDFNPSLSYFLIDRLFGGASAPTILDRTLSPIERMALDNVADRVVSDLTEVWWDHAKLQLAVFGFESIPEIMQAVEREVPCLVATVNAKFAGGSGLLSICLPLNVVEQFFTRSTDRRLSDPVGTEAERKQSREQTEASLRMTTVPTVARLPEFRIPMRDLMRLQAGSTISTGIPVGTPLELMIGDQPRFRVQAGKVKQLRAVSVLEVLSGNSIDSLVPTTRGRTAPEVRHMTAPSTDNDTAGSAGEAQAPEFADLGAALLAGGEVPFAALIDITLPVRIEVGRSTVTVGELLRLGRGSVLQLDRLAGDPMDLYVSDLRLAEGEVVVVNEHYGFRLRRIVAQLPAQTLEP
ncbi:MAG: FliM/FliN family flagellar motor switch protein [Gemmatimonadetes bacterium]|jgi:flagellar motor switch protein FliM|nr:FliM/FliN family flagellar motor switch protein [Gemmatimonadota bacterium]